MKNLSAWKIDLLSPEEFSYLPPQKRCVYLCSLAHLAPSTHNTQPWRFHIAADHKSIDVFLDQQFILPASDVVGRQAIISLGCAVENFVTAANYYGNTCTVRRIWTGEPMVPGGTAERRFAPIITLTLADGVPNRTLGPLVQSITKRQVTRAEFKPDEPLLPEVIEQLIAAAMTEGEEVKLHLVTDKIRRLSIAEFQGQADNYVINSLKFSRELGNWLLPNATTSYIGMPGNGFGLTDEEAERLHAGLVGTGPLQPEDGLRFSLGGKIGLEKSPLIAFITAKEDTLPYWLATGRLLEKILLILTRHQVQFALHAGIVEVPLIKKIFGLSLGTLRPITTLFRAGYSKNKSDALCPHSPRLPITKILLSDMP